MHLTVDKLFMTSMELIMKRVLIAGGAGFIGTHLVRTLLMEGARVTVVDNHYTSDPRNVLPFMAHENYEFHQRDVRYPLLDLGTFDWIFNLACPASPVHYQRDPVMTINTNVLGAINILELSRQCGARVFQASTSEVYGDPLVHPQPESYFGNVNTLGPRACYDEGKRCAETIFREYSMQYGVDVRVARIFNTYGPIMHPNDGRVVSNFVIQALAGETITIHGSGHQTRSFCYVTDLVAAILMLMNYSGASFEPYNLGNPNEISINELANQICDLTGAKVMRLHSEKPQDDPMRRMPVIDKAERDFGWRPSTPLVKGLTETIRYFAKLNDISLARLVA